jgi:hypothetical protein
MKKKKTIKIKKLKKKKKFKICPVCGIRIRKFEGYFTAAQGLKFHIFKVHPEFTSKRISPNDKTAHLTENLLVC